MDEMPDRTPQLKLAVYHGLLLLAISVVGSAAFWLSGNQKMVPIMLPIAVAGLFTIAAAGLQIVWIRRRKRTLY